MYQINNFIDWKTTRIIIKNQIRTFAKRYNPLKALIRNYIIGMNKVILYNLRNYKVIHVWKIAQVVKNKYPFVSFSGRGFMLLDFDICSKITQKVKKILLKKENVLINYQIYIKFKLLTNN